MDKGFDDIKNIKKLKFEGDPAKVRPKLYLLSQSWTKYLEENREIQ